ncbi:hypothetical protein BU15DRAFT_63809 [Melanogaster broomeanus]|nr:hypothetical protein BU15DRAFT_63809 [Melanogaster broomeanus]
MVKTEVHGTAISRPHACELFLELVEHLGVPPATSPSYLGISNHRPPTYLFMRDDASSLTDKSSTIPYSTDTCKQIFKLLSDGDPSHGAQDNTSMDIPSMILLNLPVPYVLNRLNHQQESGQLDRHQGTHHTDASRQLWLSIIVNWMWFGISRYYDAHPRADQWSRFMSLPHQLD